jgi:hypothetical protein
MANRQRIKGVHNKISAISVGLPAWYRPLLMAIDPTSNSRALRILVNHALQNGAAQRLLNLPEGMTDVEAIAAHVLAGQTLAQQCGGWRNMQKHLEAHPYLVGTTTEPVQHPIDNGQDELTAEELRPLGIQPHQIQPQAQPPHPPAARAPAVPSGSNASTITQTEAIMLELQQAFDAPPP